MKRKKKKKQSRRSKAKFSALDKQYTVKSRLELLDFDYLHKLNDEELAWLNKFAEEEIHSSFNIDKSQNLSTPEEELKIYNRDYIRKQDLITKMKVSKRLDYLSDKEIERKQIDLEDKLIYLIDNKKKEE
jgi:hypothetical protein